MSARLSFVLIVLICYITDFVASEDFSHANQTSRVFTNATICGFPSFLKIALGISCTQKEVKDDDHFYFAPVAQPVSITRETNATCEKGRFEWNSSNASLCCLELPCPHGQVLAKDRRNTPDGECPKCRNVVFEYICDPLNDTCHSLHTGSKCRKYFNSSDLFICGCDAQQGFTQNRLAFPAACTKTIGAVCFFQEHCKFVDPNSRCNISGDIKPPRGTCQCKKGLTENSDGRCVEKIRQVRDTAVADWGDESIWADGPVEKFPNYDISAHSRTLGAASPVLDQPMSAAPLDDGPNAPQRVERATNNAILVPHNITATTEKQPIPKPQPYMISAQHMVPNASSTNQIKVIGSTLVSSQSTGSGETNKIPSTNAGSGTKFVSDDGDSQVDDVLNIVRPAKRKLQTDRPTTLKTWDISYAPTPLATLQSSTHVPYWMKNPPPATTTATTLVPPTTATEKSESSTTMRVTTKPPTIIPAVHETFQAAARFTQKSAATASRVTVSAQGLRKAPLEGILIGDAHQASMDSTESTHSVVLVSSTASSTSASTTRITTVPSTTMLATTVPITAASTTHPTTTTTTTISTSPSTTFKTTPTTIATTTTTTTLSTSTSTVPTITSATTAKPTTRTVTSTTSMVIKPTTTAEATTQTTARLTTRPATALPVVPLLGDQDETVSLDSADGVIRVQLGDTAGRFGGVVRVPSHSVIGGVGRPRPAQPQGSNIGSVKPDVIHSSQSPTATATVATTLPMEHAVAESPPTLPGVLPTPEYEHHGVDLSFLQDKSLSKVEMHERLLQALVELSATTVRTTLTTTPTTTTTTTTTTTATTTKPAIDLSFLSDSSLSAADIQMRLLPLLMQLNSQLTSPVPVTTTVPTISPPMKSLLTTNSALDVGLSPNASLALAQLRQIQAVQKSATTRQLSKKAKSTEPTTVATTSAESSDDDVALTTTVSTVLGAGLSPEVALALAKLRQMQAAERLSTTKQLSGKAKITKTTTVATTSTDGSEDEPYSTIRPQKKRPMSFFSALWSGLGSMSPRRNRNHTQDDVETSPTIMSTTQGRRTTTSTSKTTQAGRTKSQIGAMDDLVDASGLPVPSFSQVFTGLAGIAGSIFGRSKSPTGTDYLASTGQRGVSMANLKTNNGKIDMTDPKTQMLLAKMMQQTGSNSASQSYGSGTHSQEQPGTQKGNPNSKFNFDSPSEQVQFVKFLQTFDKYQPAGSQAKGSNPLFPQPPPMRAPAPEQSTPALQPVTPPAPATGPVFVNPAQGTADPNKGIALPADSLSPEVWEIINQMQKPGYYNLTKEQLAALAPVMKQIKAQEVAAGGGKTFPAHPAIISATPPPATPPQFSQQFQGSPPDTEPSQFGAGDPWSSFGAVPPVPPLLPQPLPTDQPEQPTTASSTASTTTTTTTTITTTTPVTTTPPKGEAKMLFPILDGNVQLTSNSAPGVKPPSQPPFRDVIQKHDCPTNCQQEDPNLFCDTRIGTCLCKPGYHSSFLEGNVCTKTILSLCSGDEDCQSGGDMNTACVFNGLNRFCACSNGYLPDNEGTCRPMFAERCTGVCNIPNAVCDQFQGICRCPTGYAWFKDPWTGQPVCRAALGGAVPCRGDQDLCPIFTPRGKCRNNAFCGCEEGYIPDSWFTNQSERTSCIDVLSAKCDDSSDCTVADRNTICDRRLRMCVCKTGYKPDPFHNSACIAAT